MALRDIALSTDGVGAAFLDEAARDGYGNRLAYNLIWIVLHLTNRITLRFLDGVLDTIEPITQQAIRINDRLQIVTPEQEERALKLREEAAKAIRTED